jgi:hypothetical protein
MWVSLLAEPFTVRENLFVGFGLVIAAQAYVTYGLYRVGSVLDDQVFDRCSRRKRTRRSRRDLTLVGTGLLAKRPTARDEIVSGPPRDHVYGPSHLYGTTPR